METKPMLLTVREVSQLLRVQRTKVYILIESGALIGAKIGSEWRIRTESVEALVGPLPNELRWFNSEPPRP
jgi:excisionase family DNA binding protein